MTDNELDMWRAIGADMGLEFDQLGHPYQTGPTRDMVSGEQYHGAFDWRPLEDDGDSFRLMLHYRLQILVTDEWAYAWRKYGQALSGRPLGMYRDKAEAVRHVLFYAAFFLVSQPNASIASHPNMTKV